MRTRVTLARAKQICDYGVGYHDIQLLLDDLMPWGYVEDNDNWVGDLYDIGFTVICTGDVLIGKRISYQTLSKFEKEAAKVVRENPDFTLRKEKLSKLRKRLMEGLCYHEFT